MEDAAAGQQQQQPQSQLMTKLTGLTPSNGTTLIYRSGHCYQLHRPHLGLPSESVLAAANIEENNEEEQQQQQQDQNSTQTHKKFKADHNNGVDPESKLAVTQEQMVNFQQQQLTPLALRQQQHQQQITGHSVSHILDIQNHQRQTANGSRSKLSTNSQSVFLQHQQQHLQHQQHLHHHQNHHNHHHHHHHQHPFDQQQQHQQQQQQANASTHVSCLYPEILALIFSKLDVRDRGRAAQVCTTWREAAYHRSAWRGVEAKLHLRKHANAVFPCLEKRGIKRVQVLSLTVRRGLGDVFRNVSKLQSLNLSGCYNMSDTGLNNALSQSYPSLTELNLSLCKNITDASLGKIANSLRNLESLELGGCSNITNMGLHVVSWGLKKLRRLDLRSCWHVSDQGIAFLAGTAADDCGTPKLEHLGLQDCQRLSDEGLRHLAQGLSESLRSINLSFCVLITDSGMKHVAKITSLRELDLRSCDNISEIGMAYLAEGGSRVSSLDVSFCDKIGDSALQHVSQGLFNLKSLGLSACPITDEGIAKIARSQKILETLHIGQCSKLTDRSVFSIIENMPALRCIDLYGCTRISKYGLDKIDKLRISLNLRLWQERR